MVLRHTASQPSFVFFGSLAGLGSRSGLHFLLEDVFPGLRRHWGLGGFRLLLAGSGVLPEWARAALAGRSEIAELGFVEDLGALLATCHAALFPISVPIGNRSRILTAMSYRVPVVAHRNCALGNIDLVDGETAFLARDGAEFSARLTSSSWLVAENVAERAYLCYKTRFHPDAACGRLAARLKPFCRSEEACREPRHRRPRLAARAYQPLSGVRRAPIRSRSSISAISRPAILAAHHGAAEGTGRPSIPCASCAAPNAASPRSTTSCRAKCCSTPSIPIAAASRRRWCAPSRAGGEDRRELQAGAEIALHRYRLE